MEIHISVHWRWILNLQWEKKNDYRNENGKWLNGWMRLRQNEWNNNHWKWKLNEFESMCDVLCNFMYSNGCVVSDVWYGSWNHSFLKLLFFELFRITTNSKTYFIDIWQRFRWKIKIIIRWNQPFLVSIADTMAIIFYAILILVERLQNVNEANRNIFHQNE